MADKEEKVVNTTKSLSNPKGKSNKELEAEIKKAKKQLDDEKTVKFGIPKNFQKAIGPTLLLSVNGVRVVLPVDGEEYEIPKTLAEHGKAYLNSLTI